MNQLNRHDATVKDTLDQQQQHAQSPTHLNNCTVSGGGQQSRPISLLSVNSTTSAATTTHTTSSTISAADSSTSECTRKKLDDLKSCCQLGGSVFAQTLEPMDALHRTLESILSLTDQQPNRSSVLSSSSCTPSPATSSYANHTRDANNKMPATSTLLYDEDDCRDSSKRRSNSERISMIESYIREQTAVAAAASESGAEASLRGLSDDDDDDKRTTASSTSTITCKNNPNTIRFKSNNIKSEFVQSIANDMKPTSPSGNLINIIYAHKKIK